MAAVTATFGTNGLLESVLELIGLEDFPVADQVCKAWRQIISKSGRLCAARCLTPKYLRPMDQVLVTLASFGPWQYYEYDEYCKINSALTCDRQDELWLIKIPKDLVNIPSQAQERNQLISHPPITHVTVFSNSILGTSANLESYCSLRNLKGITLGELLDVSRALGRIGRDSIDEHGSSAEGKLEFRASLAMWDAGVDRIQCSVGAISAISAHFGAVGKTRRYDSRSAFGGWAANIAPLSGQ